MSKPPWLWQVLRVLPLDSDRWSDLEHAYGSARDIPTLLARLRAERQRPPGESAWAEIYDSLCHQYSLYSATYAALPHLLDIAASGTPYQRFEVLILAGTCAVQSAPAMEVPADLEGELETFIAAVRSWSLPALLDRVPVGTELNHALQAVGGLRHPQAAAVHAVGRLYASAVT